MHKHYRIDYLKLISTLLSNKDRNHNNNQPPAVVINTNLQNIFKKQIKYISKKNQYLLKSLLLVLNHPQFNSIENKLFKINSKQFIKYIHYIYVQFNFINRQKKVKYIKIGYFYYYNILSLLKVQIYQFLRRHINYQYAKYFQYINLVLYLYFKNNYYFQFQCFTYQYYFVTIENQFFNLCDNKQNNNIQNNSNKQIQRIFYTQNRNIGIINLQSQIKRLIQFTTNFKHFFLSKQITKNCRNKQIKKKINIYCQTRSIIMSKKINRNYFLKTFNIFHSKFNLSALK
eukprot:TRINITY_DN2640_c1_g1_i1.p2 TRINITY_DN2640_c1_g1~~TRINITY_DN2640_c1_g1_i1.p2  ORF type:complete len:294 (+),score=-21.30 TRINITY_DN2640_c1_g1_i1:27-884(+)